MSQPLQHQLADLPLFGFVIQTERDLEDALDDWLADDHIDVDRRHVLRWCEEEAEREARQ